jgi:hypothetical protein
MLWRFSIRPIIYELPIRNIINLPVLYAQGKHSHLLR